MDKELRILILEDVPADAELEEHELRKSGLVFTSKVVGTRETFLKALDEFFPDLILSGYDLPSFDSFAALRVAKEKCPDVPFILVTGELGEEFAIEKIKEGATDYVLKNNLKRLVPVINRALEEAKQRTERKRLEAILKKEQQELKLIIDSSPIIVFYKDKEGKFIRVNKAFAEALKMPEEEFVGKTVFDLYSAKTAQDMTNDDQEVLKSGRPKLNIIEQYESASGIRWVQTDKIPICDNNGIPVGLIGFAQDITERKKAEEEIKILSSVVEQSTEGIATAGLDGKLTFVNKTWCRMHGYKSSKELLGKSLAIFHNKQQMENEVKPFNEKLIELGAYSGEVWHITRGGKPFPTLMTSTVLKDKQGKPYALVGIAKDITERKRAEEMLQKSELKYRQLMEQAPDMIFVVDGEGNLLHVNLMGQKMLGYSEDELCKMTTVDTYPLDEMAVARHRLMEMRTMRAGETMHFERQMRRKDGTLFPVEISIGALKDGTTHGIIRDITERKRAEEQLQSLFRRLVEIQEADYRLLAGDLHDQVGQNLTALSINLSFIRDRFPDVLNKLDKKIVERLEDSLKLVEDAIEHIRNLMVGLRPPVLDDYGLVSAIRWHSERFSERTGVSIVLQAEELSPRLPVIVETALFRIFQEVLTNVAKHARARQVNIALKEINGMVQLTITDNGVGFDPSDMQKLKKEPGWGLITIEERAKAFGGHSSVISAANQGTQVVVKVQR